MPVPSAPTGLTADIDHDGASVTLAWTNPVGSLTGTKIEVTTSGDGAWVTHYDSASVSSRVLWELCPTIAYDIRVSAKNASGYSTPVQVSGITPGLVGYILGIIVLDMALPTRMVPFGFTGQADQGWDTLTSKTAVDLAGQTSPRFFRTRKHAYQWDFDFNIRPTFTLRDGSQLTRLTLNTRLDEMEDSDGVLYKDYRGITRYCILMGNKDHYVSAATGHAQGSLLTTLPPATKFTTAP